MSSLCKQLGYSRQAFYKQQHYSRQQAYEAALIIEEVKKHRLLQPRLGTRKLLVLLKQFTKAHQIKLGRDGLFNLLRIHQLLVKRRKIKAQTTFSKHWYQRYPNLIKQYEPLAPNLLWVSHITYIVAGNSFAYLSLITDAYSKK